MKRIDIKADYICNNNCLFCVIGEEERHVKAIPIEEIRRELSDARKQGATDVALTGGEPTIRREILDLVSYAKQLGYSTIMLITNGRMLSNSDFAGKLVAAGANRFMFSIHGINEGHDDLTRVPGSYRQAVQGMKNVKALGIEIVTDTVATRKNCHELPAIVRHLLQAGAAVCQVDFVIPCGSAWHHKESIIPPMKDVAPYVHKVIDDAKRAGDDKKILVMGLPYCQMKGYEGYMNEPNIPEIKISAPEAAHRAEDYNEHRVEGKVKPEKCRMCEHFSRCEGVWENYIQLYGDGELVVK